MHRKEAIALKCKECIYDPLDEGTFLKQVFNCEITTCPLYPFRPVPRVRKNHSKAG